MNVDTHLAGPSVSPQLLSGTEHKYGGVYFESVFQQPACPDSPCWAAAYTVHCSIFLTSFILDSLKTRSSKRFEPLVAFIRFFYASFSEALLRCWLARRCIGEFL